MSGGRLYIWNGAALYAARHIEPDPHAHYAASLLLSLDDPFDVELENERVKLRACLLGPNLHHRLVARDTRMIVLQLDPDSAEYESLAFAAPSPPRLYPLEYDRFAPAESELAHLFDDPLGCGKARRIFLDILDLAGAAPRRDRQSELDPRLVKTLETLKADLPDRVTVPELAAQAGLSADRFMHLFKDQLGLPVRRYALWLRMFRAVRALAAGLSLTDAAHEAGFADSAHLSRTFRENFGYPPSFFFSGARNVQVRFCMGA